MDKDQLREFITNVLLQAEAQDSLVKPGTLCSEAAVELLMMTAAQETKLGRYIKQINGPALGIFQIEPKTYWDLHKNYLAYRMVYRKLVNYYESAWQPIEFDLMGNLPFQIIAARVIYKRDDAPLPDANDIKGMAQYYKRVWNTSAGKATPDEAEKHYRKYAI